MTIPDPDKETPDIPLHEMKANEAFITSFADTMDAITDRGLEKIALGIVDLYVVMMTSTTMSNSPADSTEEIKEMREQFIIGFGELLGRLASTEEEFSWFFKAKGELMSPFLMRELIRMTDGLEKFTNAPNN